MAESTELVVEDLHYDTDYEIGQDNIAVLGMDLHNPVFPITAGLTLVFVVGSLLFPEASGQALLDARAWTLGNFDWFFALTGNLIFLFCLVLVILPIGRTRLGGPDAKPEFSTLSWLTMLFSAGVGIGLMFWGAAEPLAYYTGWGGTPLNVAAETAEAKRLAMSASIFHWSVTPWAIYAVVGLALAFFSFNRGLPLTIRSAFYPLLGERIWGWPGHLIDLFAVISTLFGLATSLGLGAQQAASGLHYLFAIDPGLATQVGIIILISAMAILSLVRGLDKGIKVLSNLNMAMAGLLLVFVVICGPTLLILTGFGRNTLGWAQDLLPLSNWVGRSDLPWYHDWTIFYWAWWVSWSPFVGMFIARISKGRTIRQFMAAVLIAPMVVCVLWFTAFGETAIWQTSQDVGGLADGVTRVSLVLFQMLHELPWATASSVLAILLLMIFFVTSSDSGSLVVDSITSGGKTNGPTAQRVFWAVMVGVLAAVLLFGGGKSALAALQAGTIASALPFTAVLLVWCVALTKGLLEEQQLIKAAQESGTG